MTVPSAPGLGLGAAAALGTALDRVTRRRPVVRAPGTAVVTWTGAVAAWWARPLRR